MTMTEAKLWELRLNSPPYESSASGTISGIILVHFCVQLEALSNQISIHICRDMYSEMKWLSENISEVEVLELSFVLHPGFIALLLIGRPLRAITISIHRK